MTCKNRIIDLNLSNPVSFSKQHYNTYINTRYVMLCPKPLKGFPQEICMVSVINHIYVHIKSYHVKYTILNAHTCYIQVEADVNNDIIANDHKILTGLTIYKLTCISYQTMTGLTIQKLTCVSYQTMTGLTIQKLTCVSYKTMTGLTFQKLKCVSYKTMTRLTIQKLTCVSYNTMTGLYILEINVCFL